MKTYTNTADIKEKIYTEYRNHNVALNSAFFNFPVKATKKDLIEIYAEIQKIINGDNVIRLKNLFIDAEDFIKGEKAKLIPDGDYKDIYDGNYKDFLENFNDKEMTTGLCRVMDLYEHNGFCYGIKLDFLF